MARKMTDYHQLTSWTSEELDQEIKSTFQMYDTTGVTWATLKTDEEVFDYLSFLDMVVAVRDRSWVHCFKCRAFKRCHDEWTCRICANY